jgi:transposase
VSASEPIDLAADNALLRAAVASLTEAKDQLQAQVVTLTEKLEVLLARVAQMSRRMYAHTTERHDPNQQTIFGDPPAAPASTAETAATAPPAATTAAATTAAEPAAAARRRGGKKPGEGRIAIPVHLTEKEEIVDLPESERLGSDGQPLTVVDHEITYKLDFVAGGFVRRKIVKPIYGRNWNEDEPKVSAPMPACIVPGGKATDDLILHLLQAKYGHHLPLHRLEEMAREAGIELPRSTIMDWIRAATDLLAPVAEAIKSETLAAVVLHVDDTPVRQLDPGAGKCRTARFWVYRSATAAWYHYTENRAGVHPQTVLIDYTGFLVADAYAGFDRIFIAGTAIEIACWAHTRRKFFEALHPPDPQRSGQPARAGDPRADQALAKIRELYRIEREIAGLPPDQRHRHRRERSRPILDAFKLLLDAWSRTCRPTEPLAKAVTYALNQWEALGRFVDTGIAPIDNNPAENALRTIAVGRKNWLFTGSADGGASAAIAYTLIQTAKINGLNPATYLADTVRGLLAKAAPATLTPACVADRRAADERHAASR